MTYSVSPLIVLVISAVVCAAAVVRPMVVHAADTPNQNYEDFVKAPSLTQPEVQKIYKARELGTILYSEKKYAEALPHIMTAATHGLKKSQAQLGFMHLHGLGNAKKDTRYAVGWLGVAAQGKSTPEISHYYEDIWAQIPIEHVPSYESLVQTFVAKFGARAHNVICRRVNDSGSKITKLRCMLTTADGWLVSDAIDEAHREIYFGVETVGAPPGVGAPLQ